MQWPDVVPRAGPLPYAGPMTPALELPTTLAYALGGYTVAAAFGSQGASANLVLDTGSSTLAVLPRVYAPDRDEHLAPTSLVQQINYGGGAWAGPVLRSRLRFGHGHHERCLPDAVFALVESDSPVLREADGIWGLAYRELDPAYDLAPRLAADGHDPALSWPWPYATGHALDLANFRDFLHQQPRTTLTPAFTALEQEGVVRNRFAMTVGRAVVHVQPDATSARQRAADPLNDGVLVLGGGEAQQHLYEGPFASIRILHDLYYNANLRAVRVGDEAAIAVPPLPDSEQGTRYSNALLDTGSSFLLLDGSVYDAVMAAFARRDADFPDLVQKAGDALARGEGLPSHAIDPRRWPDLHFRFERPDGGDVELRVPASHYWPDNALAHGQRLCLLARQLSHFSGQSILGLPLFADGYVVFDRAAGDAGVVRVAQRRAPR